MEWIEITIHGFARKEKQKDKHNQKRVRLEASLRRKT